MGRRELREHIFKLLFFAEFHSKEEMAEQESLYMEDLGELDDKYSCYIKEKFQKIVSLEKELDQEIDQVAQGWKTGRMGKVDLAILRLAAYEIRKDEEIPEQVAINEAVELAKKFGGDDSSAFINGILAKLVK